MRAAYSAALSAGPLEQTFPIQGQPPALQAASVVKQAQPPKHWSGALDDEQAIMMAEAAVSVARSFRMPERLLHFASGAMNRHRACARPAAAR